MISETLDVVKILILTTVSFILAIALTPIMTHFLFKYKIGKQIRTGGNSPIFTSLHQKKEGTPTMGGIIIWFTVLVVALIFYGLSLIFDVAILDKLNFLTRPQTFLPLGALIASALIGLLDDFLGVRRIGTNGGGLTMTHRLLTYTGIALIGAFWFYFKLDWDIIHIPFIGYSIIGWWYIPIFVFVIVATAFSVNETDGLDGLAGGVLLSGFASYGVISFLQGKTELAAFCGVIVGALLAFLWFNINPARFFMGDTGAMSLGVTLGIVALLTNTALFLPIIGFILVIESLSVIVQLTYKKITGGKKIFLSTPIHHHFEAKGWPEAKIVMRFWIITGVASVIGLILFLLDKAW